MINAQTRFVWRYVWNLGSPKVFRKEKQKPLQIDMIKYVFLVFLGFLQVFKDVFLETSLVAFQKRSRQSSLGRPITVVSLAGAWEEIEGFLYGFLHVFFMKKHVFCFLFMKKMFFCLFLVTFVGLTFGLFVGTVSVFC